MYLPIFVNSLYIFLIYCRLGDSRETVREKALIVLQKLTECQVFSAQILLSKLIPYFKHKNAKLREEILRCVVLTLNE